MLDESIKEYLVQITIIEGRHLVPKDDNGLSNPFVKIRIGKSVVQSTEVIMECLTPVWNQSFTFSNLMLSDQDFQTGELMVEMFSKNRFFGNSLIGGYSIGLSTLYKNANHEYFNVWLSLSNPEYPDEAQGYLLVDCFIIRAGDRPPVHSINDKFNQDVGEEDEELNLDNMKFDELKAYQEKQQGIIVLGKPSIASKGFQLSCYIFKAEGLCKFPGTFGDEKPSAFISVRTVGLVKITKTISNNSNPVYNQKLMFPSYLPFLNDKIVMRIWNSNSRSADDFIANIPEFSGPNDVFNISKLLSMGGRMAAIWVNLYCIPPCERNTYSTKKKHPRSGTYFMGRVLLAFFLLPNPTPYFGTLPCNMMSDPPSQSYRLFADIYELKYLKDYEILVWCDVNIGGHSASNKKKKVKDDGAIWRNTPDKNEISLQQIMQNFPVDVQQIPDIIISLYTGPDVNDKNRKRLGFVRIKSEEVLKMDHTPRWMHFNAIDLNYESPGSILINLQFVVDSSSVKRVLKEKGLDKRFKLYAHIIQGFDLDPTNSRKTENNYTIEVFMDSNSILRKDDMEKNKKVIPNQEEKQIKGEFPFYNEVVMIDTDLDLKLDFAPDLVVNLKNKNEEIGLFTVPIRSIRKKKENDYPHYFNFIRNNQIVGRLLAMFYISSAPTKKKADITPKALEDEKIKIFKLYKKLNVRKRATVKVFVHGVRDMDFSACYKDCKLRIKILSNSADDDQMNILNYALNAKAKSTAIGATAGIGNKEKINEPKENIINSNEKEIDNNTLADLNYEENSNFINICHVFEFNTWVYGDPKGMDTNDDDDANLTMFPMIEFKLIKSGIFIDTERFLLMNLSEFYPGFSEKTKLKYQKIFEDNLSKKKIDQEQNLINIKSATGSNNKKNENELFPSRNEGDEEMNEEEMLLYTDNDRGIRFKEKPLENKNQAAAPLIKIITQKEINDFITKYEKFDFHKFLDITTEDCICLKQDKDKEREAKRKLIKSIKVELDELRRRENLTPQEVEELIKFQDQIRELKKPVMSENIFYGFEDVSDDYDYGTEVFKDDIYEFHPNMKIPYKERNMIYIPNGLFEEKCNDIGGYMKLGKESSTRLKFNIQVTVHDEEMIDPNYNLNNQINFKNKNKKGNTATGGGALAKIPSTSPGQDMELSYLKENSKKLKIVEKPGEVVIIKEEKETEEFVKEQLEKLDVFNNFYVEKLNKVFFTKERKKTKNKDSFAFPITGLRVRVYIFRCLNLTAQENSNSIVDNLAGYSAYCKANSFIEIKLGDNSNAGEEKGIKYVNDMSSLVENTLNPNFFKFYELDADLPQDWRLEISIKSKGTSSDSLIGSTVIDLENRYLGDTLCREILQIKSLEEDYIKRFELDNEMPEDKKAELNKRINLLQIMYKDLQDAKIPVEFRPLYKPNTMTAQGIIEMLVEVLPMKIAKIKKPLKIEPPPAQEYELRLVIWETRNVFVPGKKTLDLYIRVAYDPEGWLSEPIIKETDTHLGCSSGRGIYNWRMKFSIKIPCTFPRLNFRIYDFNTLSSDEALGECYISLKRVFKKLMQQGELTLDKKWIPLAKKNDSGDVEGEILISIYFIPQDIANQNPVGEAQEDPNKDPYLERPKEGRGILDFLAGTFLDFSGWSFNFDLFGNLKLLAILGTVLTVFVVLFISPGILTK